jgi:hypothetical protein
MVTTAYNSILCAPVEVLHTTFTRPSTNATCKDKLLTTLLERLKIREFEFSVWGQQRILSSTLLVVSEC